MTKLYEHFEEWFKVRYPYPTSLMVTPTQKEHLRDAYLAGAEKRMIDHSNFLEQLLDDLKEKN